MKDIHIISVSGLVFCPFIWVQGQNEKEEKSLGPNYWQKPIHLIRKFVFSMHLKTLGQEEEDSIAL